MLAACVGDAALVSDRVNGSEVTEQPREGSMTFRRIASFGRVGLGLPLHARDGEVGFEPTVWITA